MSTPILHHIADPAARPLPDLDWRARLDRLRVHVAALDRVVVAYSGGVDSSVVLRVAHEVLGDAAIGVIGRSDSYALSELEAALAQAADFGVRVDVVTTGERARLRAIPLTAATTARASCTAASTRSRRASARPRCSTAPSPTTRSTTGPAGAPPRSAGCSRRWPRRGSRSATCAVAAHGEPPAHRAGRCARWD
jgi:hypothetical protein